jgi:hypothetical protein
MRGPFSTTPSAGKDACGSISLTFSLLQSIGHRSKRHEVSFLRVRK